ncbi:hypothetical protein ACN42_g2796 [Penicillium freii]|uniref:Uncharacterized protein n=1 Tax=Penicillium freii TaxID=48697 RepID=A0A117NQR1_PENFR|nr:hypothetical protein ACN42_g2796 [Penicillium freii]
MTIFSIRETEEHSFMFERCIALLSDRGATSSGILEQKLRDPLISAYITSQFRLVSEIRDDISRLGGYPGAFYRGSPSWNPVMETKASEVLRVALNI